MGSKKKPLIKRISQSEWAKRNIPLFVGAMLNVWSFIAPDHAAKIALKLFVTPRNGDIKPWHKKFLSRFTQRQLEVDGMKVMNYDSGGDGKVILLCHGWESNSFRWRKLINHLKSKEYRFVMLDAPAHGQSGSDTFNAIKYASMIDEVSQEYKPDVIIGHSVGGFAALLYLAHYPHDWIQKVIILASPDRLETITDTYFSMLKMNKKIRKHYEELILKKFGKPTSYYNASDFVKNINLPGIIIHDKNDDTNFYWEAENIIKHWQKGRLIAVEGFGHGLQGKEIFEIVEKELEG